MNDQNLDSENLSEIPPQIPVEIIKPKKYKRSNYLINKSFQYRFVLYTFIPSAFSLIVFYAAIQFYYTRLIQEGIASGLNPDHPYFNLIHEQIRFMNTLFLVCGFSSFIFFIFWGIFISHKIAGPLYRLTMFFKNAEPGMIKSRLSFRPGDFFLEIPDAINSWIEKSR